MGTRPSPPCQGRAVCSDLFPTPQGLIPSGPRHVSLLSDGGQRAEIQCCTFAFITVWGFFYYPVETKSNGLHLNSRPRWLQCCVWILHSFRASLCSSSAGCPQVVYTGCLHWAPCPHLLCLPSSAEHQMYLDARRKDRDGEVWVRLPWSSGMSESKEGWSRWGHLSGGDGPW